MPTCLDVSAPRKNPNHSWLSVYFPTRMTFSCFFINLNLVELDGSVGCCVEMVV